MRPKVLLLLQTLTLLAALCLLPGTDGPAFARTTVTKTGECEVTVRIDIEVFPLWVTTGDPPTADGLKEAQETAKKWERQIENAWNGPTADVAKEVAEANGLDPLPSGKKTPEAVDKALKDRAKVDELARKKLEEAGVPEGRAWENCCRICFDVNIIVNRTLSRQAYPTRHKIDIAPPGSVRSYVRGSDLKGKI